VPPPRIYFIRHGETDWNAAGRLQGQHDIALNERGREQAAQAARHLRDVVADPGALPWIVSPLERTRDTAEIARTALRLPREDYRLEPLIVELSFGRWEGLTWREVGKLDPLAARKRETHKWEMVPPDGDSYALLAERIRPWLAGLTQDIVAVSHAGVARVLLHLHAGVSVQKAPKEDIWQGRVLVIEHGRSSWS
jgi:broad specificity phosphatase PhoE